MNQKLILLIGLIVAIGLLLTLGRSSLERSMMFFPTHERLNTKMMPWIVQGHVVGFSRPVESPRTVWLMLHGNGGQAEHRTYALPHFSPDDAVYILEYPGYGARAGTPSRSSLNQAAQEAYRLLRGSYPKSPVCVVGESIGSGPACSLAGEAQPPDKIVLIVPFDTLSGVARDHYPAFLVGMLLSNDWNNIEALARYRGPVDIFGGKFDNIIPVTHAQALAAALPKARFTLINSGHNDWSDAEDVKIRNP